MNAGDDMERYIEDTILSKYEKTEAVTYYMKDCKKVSSYHLYTFAINHFLERYLDISMCPGGQLYPIFVVQPQPGDGCPLL